MAWLGGGFSSLKGQITNFAKGVLLEEGDDKTGENLNSRPRDNAEPGVSSSQKWDEAALQSTDKFLGQDAHEEEHSWNKASGLPSIKDETSLPKEPATEKEVVSLIPRGIANFFQMNPSEHGSTSYDPTKTEKLNQGIQTDDANKGNSRSDLEIKHLLEENQRLIQQNSSLSASVSTLNRVVQDLESQVAVSQDENANLSTGLEELDIQHQQAIEQIIVGKDETQKQYEVLKVEYNHLEDKYNAMQIEYEELKKKEETQKYLEEAKISGELLFGASSEKDLIQEIKERDESLEFLEIENVSLRNTIDELNEQIDKHDKHLPPILENSEEFEALEQRAMSLEREISILREVRTNLETEVGSSKDRIDELIRSIQMLEAMLKNQENLIVEVDTLTSRNMANESRITLLSKESDNIKVEYEGTKSILAHLENEILTKDCIIRDLRESLSQKSERLCLKDQEHEKFEQERDTRNTKLSHLECQLKHCDAQLANVQKDCESKDRKMCEILLDYATLEEDFKNYKKDSESKYLALNNDFERFKTEISDERDIVQDSLNFVNDRRRNLKVSQTETQDGYSYVSFECEDKITQTLEKVDSDFDTDVSLLRIRLDEETREKQHLMLEIEKVQLEMRKIEMKNEEINLKLNDNIQELEKEVENLQNISQEFEIWKDISRQKEIEFKNQIHSKEEELLKYRIALKESEVSKDTLLEIELSLRKELEEKKMKLIQQETSEKELKTSVQQKCDALKHLQDEHGKKHLECKTISEKLAQLIFELDNYKKDYLKVKEENENLIIEKEVNQNKLQQEAQVYEENSKLHQQIDNLKIMYQDVVTEMNEVKVIKEDFGKKLVSFEEVMKKQVEDYNKLMEEKALLYKSHTDSCQLIQLKEIEISNLQIENQRISGVLKNELEKSERILIEKIECDNKFQESEKKYEEKFAFVEQLEASHDKKVNVMKQEIESLKNQLEYASQLLRVVDRQEAEGQPSVDASIQKYCPEGCNHTREELSRISKALMTEQSQSHIILQRYEEVSEKLTKTEAQLITLRQHLVEVEDNYSAELMTTRDKISELQTKLLQAEERVRSSSTAYTSASIRANQQVEILSLQVKALTEQNDKLEAEMSKSEDAAHRQTAAITNLQAVLHQFQRDKQKDIEFETERLNQKLEESFKKNSALHDEIKLLQEQLNEAKKGLAAATRLTEQLDKKTEMITSLRTQVQELENKLHQEEQKLQSANNTVEGKVDRCLIKNLVVGYVCSPIKNKDQVLRIISTVLDLNKEEKQKVGLEPCANPQQQSLSEAFIRFLETESQPKLNVLLPLAQPETSMPPSRKTSQQGPGSLLLTDDIPNLPHFMVGRNSGSILKDVLKDRNS